MKRFAFLTGFLILTTAVAIPLFLKKKLNAAGGGSDSDRRYDIDEYMAVDGL
jgi:hypothetical protein